MKLSPGADPRIRRFLQTLPGLFDWTVMLVPSARARPVRRSTTPSMPKLGMVLPVRASIACRKLLMENSSRLSFPSSLCQ